MTRNVPAHLLGVAVFTVGAAILLQSARGLLGTAGTLALGIPLLLVLPGYTLVLVLFGPSRGRSPAKNQSDTGIEHRSGLVTLALAVGFSVVLVPILVRVVMATIGYSRANVVFSVTALVVVLALVGSVRSRGAAAPGHTGPESGLRSVRGRVRDSLQTDTRFGLATTILLVVSAVFFLSTVGFALSGDPAGESYTEFYVLTENESGDLVASGYPTTLDEAASTPLVVGIENNEHENVTYTVVVEVQRLDNQSVAEEAEVLRTQRTVAAGETATIDHVVETEMTGTDLRVQYYLYRGSAPPDADVESAYRTVHLSLEGSSEASVSR